MSIVPSGTRRKVVAQGLDQNAGFGIGDIPSAEPQSQEPALGQEPGPPETEVKAEPLDQDGGDFVKIPEGEENKSDEASDVSQYIFKKLQSFGYPPRRLERFEEEFVHEQLFPGGSREIEIVIPDRYYGKKQRITDKDFATIVKEIQNKFDLSFTKADRKDKKLIIQFASDNPQDSDGEEEVAGDVLDEIYGGGAGGGEAPSKPKTKKNPTKKAGTMSELLKMSKSQLVERLVNGDLK